MNKIQSKVYRRRKFITTVAKLAGTSMVVALPGVSGAASLWQPNSALTVQQVIDLILKEVPNAPFPGTVDKIISGSPGRKFWAL